MNKIEDSRLKVFPEEKIRVESLKSTLPDGSVVKADLEYVEQDIKLGEYDYHIFVGSTAGKKGFPNQDFAGLVDNTIKVNERDWECLFAIVCDGVSSRERSEETSKSIVENAINSFTKVKNNYKDFEQVSNDLWQCIADGAQKSSAHSGVSTVSAFLLAASGKENVGIAINCGDSRVYWATSKQVYSAPVHTDLTSRKGAITFALGADRVNSKIYKDVFVVKDSIPVVFLCTDTFAYRHDGVHFPEELIPSFGRGIGFLNDNLTAISIRRKIDK